MNEVRAAIAGCGNVGQSLVLGSASYAEDPRTDGLITDVIGPYGPGSLRVVAAFDVDERKVGRPLSTAVYLGGNVTPEYATADPDDDPIVVAGPLLDGVGRSLSSEITSTVDGSEDAVVEELRARKVDVLVNLVPVGSTEVTHAYARCALRAGVGMVNAIPVPLARDPEWARRFAEAGLPLVGDDVKSQVGATLTHRVLVKMFRDRGLKLRGTSQINVAGAPGDFLNMQDEERLTDKRISKLQAIQDVCDEDLSGSFIGPAGLVPYLGDQKVAYIDVEGFGFAGNPVRVHTRIDVLDSPNAAGVIYDAARWCRLAMDVESGGVLDDVSAFLMKAPREGMADDAALESTRARNRVWTEGPGGVSTIRIR